jgi:NitT/TauT family transport system substrate-binding protein
MRPPTRTTRARTGVIAAAAATLLLAACGTGGTSEGGGAAASTAAANAGCTSTTKVKLQLQWVAQSQFAGYYAAKDTGLWAKECLDVTIVEGGVDIVPQTQLATGAVDFAIAWVPKALASREQGAKITDIGQIYQRSGTLQVSWKNSGLTSAASLAGKKVGNWGFGNEFELFAGLQKAGVDPKSGVTLVQQQFDMAALLSKQIDAAQAMIYNEYAQVLEQKNPSTGALYQPSDLNVIDWNKDGVAMLQDAIWANTDKLKNDTAYQDTAVKLLKGAIAGWAYCRDNFQPCVDIVIKNGPTLGASHQAWQLARVNELIWPSPGGVGVIDKTLWDQTVSVATSQKVVTAAPDADAYSNTYVQKAVDALKAGGLDVTGASYKAPNVTLKEGGK